MNRIPALAVVLATVIGAWLRLSRLGYQSLWMDEGTSAWLASADWKTFLHVVLDVRSNMFLHLLLLRGVAEVGSSEVMLRLPSALFGIATIPLVYLLGRRLFDARTGAIAAALLAISPTHIVYSQEARSYAMLLFLTALTWLFYLDGMQRDSVRSWVLLALTSILAVYTHFVALLGLIVLLLCAPLVPNRAPAAIRHLLVTMAIAFAGAAPILLIMFRADVTLLGWIPTPRITAPLRWFIFLSANRVMSGVLILTAALGVAVLASMTGYLRGRPDARVSMLHIWMFFPPLIGVLASLGMAVFVPRYFIASLLPLVILVALQISRLIAWSRVPGAVAGVLIAGLMLRGALTVHVVQRENWRGAVAHVRNHAREGDELVVFVASAGRVVSHYLGDATVPTLIFPVGDETWTIPRDWMKRLDGNDQRVWLVRGHDRGDIRPLIAHRLQKTHRMVSRTRFRAVEVSLFEPLQN